jgi:hypothetical protein
LTRVQLITPLKDCPLLVIKFILVVIYNRHRLSLARSLDFPVLLRTSRLRILILVIIFYRYCSVVIVGYIVFLIFFLVIIVLGRCGLALLLRCWEDVRWKGYGDRRIGY